MSTRRQSNGRYQMKKAMRKGRMKANYKRQIRQNPNYDEQNAIWQFICAIFILAVSLFWIMHI